jgi:hypothetical protein
MNKNNGNGKNNKEKLKYKKSEIKLTLLKNTQLSVAKEIEEKLNCKITELNPNEMSKVIRNIIVGECKLHLDKDGNLIIWPIDKDIKNVFNIDNSKQ